MCGICGYLRPGCDPDTISLRDMTDAIRRRGPDTGKLWHEAASGIALGHRRLSIQDLSDAGVQPMPSACGRYICVFNGEIYNHYALRAELEGTGRAPGWRGHSDTETLLAAISEWGLDEALRRARGMFALALWDRDARRLLLARDRIGEKPLYYARIDGGWAFGSELKALLPAPGFHARLSGEAVRAYLEFGYVPEHHCIYAQAWKVPPGQVVSLSGGDATPEIRPYETFLDLARGGLRRRAATETTDEETLLSEVESCLSHVTDQQCLSDVPLGAFLSGGIDSSLITSLMQAQSATQVRSFSIGFGEARFNEAPHAAAVARHLGTDHTEFILSQADALALVPELSEIYDEPFADSSQLPTALLCREARKSVTVALSGDGGDEVFGGYNRHISGPGLWRRAAKMPRWTRQLGAGTLGAVEPFLVSEDNAARRMAQRLGLPVTTIDKLARLAPGLAEARDFAGFYRSFVTTFPDPAEVLAARAANREPAPDLAELAQQLPPAERMMAWDTLSYLPGDIMVKLDRAAMHASLETRAPFLDARVVALAWSLPLAMKIRGGRGKYVLRRLLDRHVPRALIDRPKQGFSIPLDSWLRGELQQWGAALLRRDDLRALAGLDRGAIDALWHSHQQQRTNHGQKLWTVLMLLAWVEANQAHLHPVEAAA